MSTGASQNVLKRGTYRFMNAEETLAELGE
jgi:hypothetical protein